MLWLLIGSLEAFSGRYATTKKQPSPIIATRSRTSLSVSLDDSPTTAPSHFFSRKELDDPAYSIDHELFQKLCRGVQLERPSKIQNLAWPRLLQGDSSIIADQTGSGKTLAYLIPLLQRSLRDGPTKRKGAPRILVLAPTAELADQTAQVCNRLSKEVPFRNWVVTASGNYQTNIHDQIRQLQRQQIDVLISTPGRMATILRTRNSGIDLSELQALVLDEVDVLMLDETFGPQLRTIGAASPVERTQFVFVTATLPDAVVQTIQKEFPDVAKIQGPGLHRVAPTIQERLVDVSVPARYNRDAKYCFNVKAEELFKALRQNRCRRTLIFCNTVETCRQVENVLQRKDRRGQLYDVKAYHNAMSAESRRENLRHFAQETPNLDSVLVCTDRAARGVDFDAAPVDHVVIFDFPKDPADYVRRVGRTARAGRGGSSTVMAYGWQLPIARSVMGNKRLDSSDDSLWKSDGAAEDEYQHRSKRKKRSSSITDRIRDGQMWDTQSD